MTKIMGIINVTPDSFYDGGYHNRIDAAIAQCNKLIEEGADILDIGGESSRPNAEPVSTKDELNRVIPVIKALSKSNSNTPLSIDTQKPEVAKAAINAGASLINDITGFSNPEMIKIAADSQLPICIMHMQGSPKTMQQNPHYPEGIIPHLTHWITQKTETLLSHGIKKENMILDPGIGFGKTVDDNVKIIQNLHRLRALGYPILLGISRKSFMQKILNKPASEVLPATLAVNTMIILSGVEYIRVHDVKEHRQIVKLLEELQ